MQSLEQSVLEAVNSRIRQILAGWEWPIVSDAKSIVPKARTQKLKR
jgi:hypothetical protein